MVNIPLNLVSDVLSGAQVFCASEELSKQFKMQLTRAHENSLNTYPYPCTLESWATNQTNRYFKNKTLIDNFESVILLEKLLENEEMISNPREAAEDAFNAYKSLKNHCLDPSEINADSVETECLKKLTKKFQKHLNDSQSITTVDALSLIIELFDLENFYKPKRVIFYGFIKVSPLQEKLIKTIEKAAVRCEHISSPSLSISPPLYSACNSIKEEIRKCVEFIKHIKATTPDATICITSPILKEVEGDLTYNLVKELGELGDSIHKHANTNLGEPLLDLPETQALLLTASHFMGHALCESQKRYIDQAQAFSENIEFLEDGLVQVPEAATAKEFVFLLATLMDKYGWCCSDAPEKLKILTDMEKCLQVVETVSSCGEEIPQETFLKQLEKLLSTTLHIPSSEKLHNLSILSIDEALGQSFNFTWMLGANAEYWPPQPLQSAYIPRKIDQDHNITLRDNAHTDHYTKVTQTLIDSCYEFYFSYSEVAEDRELLLPTMFDFIEELHISTIKAAPQVSSEIEIEMVTDDKGTELNDGETCPTGTRYIENMNRCHFMAHYTCRFKKLNEISDESFLENKAHGDLVHFCLEEIYSRFSSSHQLKAIPRQSLRKILSSIIEEKVREYQINSPLPAWFYHNEVEILESLLTEFLELEKTRNFVVENIEKKINLNIENLKFTLFVDRIERESILVAAKNDGEEEKRIELRLISDHKSGQVKPSDWFIEPSPSPQLLIYTMIEEADGAIYNVIRQDDVSYKGVIKDGYAKSMGIPKVKGQHESWSQQKANWKESISQTVEAIKKGVSIPNPHKASACNFCKLSRVCRINEKTDRL